MPQISEYGMTPAQFHGCLDRLWKAVEDVPRNGRDVFTIACEEIARLKREKQCSVCGGTGRQLIAVADTYIPCSACRKS